MGDDAEENLITFCTHVTRPGIAQSAVVKRGNQSVETNPKGTAILQVRRCGVETFEAVVISRDRFIVKPTTMLQDEMLVFLRSQEFEVPSRAEFLSELERKGCTTAQVKID